MDDLVKQLMHATVSIDGDFDVGCNVRDAAVERLERADAATAAAYEVVSKQLEASRETFCYASPGSDEEFTSLLMGFDTAAGAISALATPDHTAALDKLIADAVKPYAETLQYYETYFCEGFCEDMPDRSVTTASMEIDCGGCKARAILAASKKGSP